MHTSVTAITTAAEATGEFEIVLDRSFRDNEKYPALIVADRVGKAEAQNTRRTMYDLSAELTVLVFARKAAADFAELERITKAFLLQLVTTDPRFELADLYYGEPDETLGEYDVLVAYIVLRHHTTFDLT